MILNIRLHVLSGILLLIYYLHLNNVDGIESHSHILEIIHQTHPSSSSSFRKPPSLSTLLSFPWLNSICAPFEWEVTLVIGLLVSAQSKARHNTATRTKTMMVKGFSRLGRNHQTKIDPFNSILVSPMIWRMIQSVIASKCGWLTEQIKSSPQWI